jgi:excisionase family DNA binding protein
MEGVVMEKKLLSLAEVAEECAMSHATVSRWARLKLLPSYRLGGVYRVRRSDLEAFLATRYASLRES